MLHEKHVYIILAIKDKKKRKNPEPTPYPIMLLIHYTHSDSRRQRSPTSSKCWQLFSPKSLCAQSWTKYSLPVQVTSSSQMCPDPGPKLGKKVTINQWCYVLYMLYSCFKLSLYKTLPKHERSYRQSLQSVYKNDAHAEMRKDVRSEQVREELPYTLKSQVHPS